MGCLAEDELYELGRGRALSDAPEVEAHLADCAVCATVLAAVLEEQAAAGAAPPRPWGALAGRALGPYRLEAQIGAGGMGAVYRAWDERLHRNVAVKVLPGHAGAAPELTRRLETEARAAAAISHPNVVAVYDVGSADGIAYVVQELVRGESLRSLLERNAVSPARALALAVDLARGLGAAHAEGVVHRDLKPENLLVTDEGTLKILDFGLAKLAGEAPGLDVTAPGAVHGTVGYLAPETARGEPADARADLFAVGAIIYELATGQRAFGGASYAERLTAVLRDTPTLAGPLGPIVARCLDKDPKRRFQSAQDLAWALESLAGAPAVAPPASAAVAPPASAAVAPAPVATGRPSRRVFLGGVLAAGVAGVVLGDRLRRRLTPAPPRPPEFRQLTYRHGRLMSARFTRDGASIVFGAAWDGGPLAAYLLRLDGGVAHPLALPAADVLAVSSQGEMALALDRHNVEGQSALGRLALAPLDSGAPRVLADEVQEADFTADGSELCIIRRGGRGFRLELPVNHVLLDVPGWLTHARVSPDGRLVACRLHQTPVDDRGDVVVVERASGRLRTLAAGWDSVAGLAWDPSGERLWFTASASGANSAVRTVTLDGKQTLVAHTTGRLRVHDVRGDGRLAVSVDSWRLRTMSANFGGAERDLSMTDFSYAADISADGRTLLVGEFGTVEANNGTYLRPLDGAPLRVGAGLPLALSPDGTRVAVLLPEDKLGVAVYSTASAEQPAVDLGRLRRMGWGRFAAADRLVVVGGVADRPRRLWRLTLGGGAPRPLTDEGCFGRCELDPPRRRAAFIDRAGRLTILSLTDGTLRALDGDYRDQVVAGWLGDGAVAVRAVGTPIALIRVDVATGAAAPWRQIAAPTIGFKAVDALVRGGGGARYAYSYGQELSQLYLMSV